MHILTIREESGPVQLARAEFVRTANPEYFVCMLFSYTSISFRRLPYENKMHAKGTKQVRESAAVSDCTKISCVRNVGEPRIRKWSACEVFWIYSMITCKSLTFSFLFLTPDSPTGEEKTLRLVMKSKATDKEVCNMANKVAQGCGLALASHYEYYKMRTGFL